MDQVEPNNLALRSTIECTANNQQHTVNSNQFLLGHQHSRFEECECAVPHSLPKEAQQEGKSIRDAIPQPVDGGPYCSAGSSSSRTNDILSTNTIQLLDHPSLNNPKNPTPNSSHTCKQNSDQISQNSRIINRNESSAKLSTVARQKSIPIKGSYRTNRINNSSDNQQISPINGGQDIRITNSSSEGFGVGSVNPRQVPALALTTDVPSSWIEPVAAAGAGSLSVSQASNIISSSLSSNDAAEFSTATSRQSTSRFSSTDANPVNQDIRIPK